MILLTMIGLALCAIPYKSQTIEKIVKLNQVVSETPSAFLSCQMIYIWGMVNTGPTIAMKYIDKSKILL